MNRLAACVAMLMLPTLAYGRGQITPEPQAPSQTQGTTTPAPATASLPQPVRIGDPGNIVRLTGAQTSVVLTVTGLGATVDQRTDGQLAALGGTLGIAETVRLGEPALHTVRMAARQFLGRSSPGALAWLVNVSAENLLVNVSERRLTTLTLGSHDERRTFPLEFTFTNQPLVPPQYDVITPGHDWKVSRSEPAAERAYPLLIVNRSEPLSGLRVAQVSLERSDNAAGIGFGEVVLAEEPAGQPVTAVSLRPNEAKTVFLRLESSKRLLPYGSFTGQVQLASDGAPPKAVAVTARVTSSYIRTAGAALVLLGLSVSLFVTSRLQPRLARLQALRPATLLRDRLIAFTDESAALGTDAGKIVAEARRQAARLETAALDAQGLLPLTVGSAGTAGNTVAQLQALLNDISDRLGALIVLRDTVSQLVGKHPIPRPGPVAGALEELNEKASQTATPTAAQAAVAAILDRLRAQSAAAEERARAAAITTQQLDFMLQETAAVAALIWASVSLAIGVTYVYSDVDFGTPMDLLGMFLWGLGLTTFGAGVQQLTPRQVATQIGVTVPRSAGADPLRG